MAGEIIFLQGQARTVVVSISSAMPFAIFPMTLAEAGATSTTSARFARATCSTLYWKFRSKVSTRHLFPVSSSKVSGVINSVAFRVISTCTSAPSFFSIRARFTILYAAMLPVTASTTVFPCNCMIFGSFLSFFYCSLVFFIISAREILRKHLRENEAGTAPFLPVVPWRI